MEDIGLDFLGLTDDFRTVVGVGGHIIVVSGTEAVCAFMGVLLAWRVRPGLFERGMSAGESVNSADMSGKSDVPVMVKTGGFLTLSGISSNCGTGLCLVGLPTVKDEGCMLTKKYENVDNLYYIM